MTEKDLLKLLSQYDIFIKETDSMNILSIEKTEIDQGEKRIYFTIWIKKVKKPVLFYHFFVVDSRPL